MEIITEALYKKPTNKNNSLAKHRGRQGIFPMPKEAPLQINQQGQKILESIINHPTRQIIHKNTKNFGEIIDIYAPGIRGVRYKASGELVGFLEPK